MEKYNNIRVSEANVNTGNHCVSGFQIYNNKPFNFIIDGSDYHVSSNKIKGYIKDNPKCKRFKLVESIDKETQESTRRWVYFYLIPDGWIKAIAS